MIQVKLEFDSNVLKEVDTNWINIICTNIFNDNNHINANITIILSNDDRLYELKKKYFNKDLLTDVISFNLEEDGDPIEGEVYISLERIKENAIRFNQGIEVEFKRVIIHGCLHLIGFDDQTNKDKKKMTSLENYYLKYPNISELI